MQARVLGGAGGWVTAFPALSLLTRSLGAVRAEEAGFLSPGSRSFPAPSPLGGQVPGWGPGAGQAGRSLVANGSWSPCSDPLGATLAISGSWVGGVRADQTSPNLPALSLEQSLSGRRTRLPPRPSSQDPQPTRARSLQSRPQPALRTRRQGAAGPWPAPAGSPGPAPPLPVPAKPRRAGGRPWKVSAPPGPRPAPRPRPPAAPPSARSEAPGPRAARGRSAQQRPESLGRRPGATEAVASLSPGKVWGRRVAAAGPMEARGELGSGRESAGGDLLLALLARSEDLRRGGCSAERLHRGGRTTGRPRGPPSLPGLATGAVGPGRGWVREPQHVPPGHPNTKFAEASSCDVGFVVAAAPRGQGRSESQGLSGARSSAPRVCRRHRGAQ